MLGLGYAAHPAARPTAPPLCPPLCPRRRPLVNTPRCFPPPRADALLDLRATEAINRRASEGRGDERRAATVRAACVPLAAPPQTAEAQIR